MPKKRSRPIGSPALVCFSEARLCTKLDYLMMAFFFTSKMLS